MAAVLTFHPLGDADGTLIDLADGRKILIDFGDECTTAKDERRIDLAAALRADLIRSGKSGFDAVLFTHLDRDHVYGAEDFFWFDHSPRLQGGGRARIGELWVPAAAILEDELPDFAQVIQDEARYRLLHGYGVRVFSRPEALAGFLALHGRTLAHVYGLIVNAGDTVPGYALDGPERAQFFVHCPFGWRQDRNEQVVDRNQDSVVLQAVFHEGGALRRVLFASDIDSETLTLIVRTTLRHDQAWRLGWDVCKIPHHCSYTALNKDDKGTSITVPVPEVRYLFETCGAPNGIMVSTSRSIPENDLDVQPPHRQAAAYYKEVAHRSGGRFEVTMDHSPARNPQPCKVVIDEQGCRFVSLLSQGPGLLRPATTAAAGFAFPNHPVVPDKPAGFG
ncbi:hypothetical protein J2X36_003575 [Methylobacterium sp. BE186]|uniref:MBL fold metallo-hydrolase n=1 Tax=Methylobacterium sp. BE186 TaxID=2817715 RepID=UPI00285A8D03|nr:MBL fold metallo-hydrolase [Methylobacterium sp. BE186]MDR7038804.1 hypothetical protein [Methylobacterium sp. BE186]